MTILQKENGMISFKMMLILLILFVVIHIGIKWVPMYMASEAMKDEMTAKARFAQMLKDEEIRSDLANKAKAEDLPLGPDDFILQRDETNRRMKISTVWDVEMHFFFDVYPPYTVRTFHFEPVVEETYGS